MRVDHGLLQWRYDQRPQPGMGLGRHLELDPRSLPFQAPQLAEIKPTEWPTPIPTLNQGNTGSCTGHAGTYHLAALYGKDRLADVTLNGHTLTGDAEAIEPFALEVYHQATVKDGFPGEYPPDDTGSSGLGVCKALKADHLIGRYVWATNPRQFGSLLQRAGVIIGMPWLRAFFTPDSNGFIDADPNWMNSEVDGGHEIYVEALEAWDDTDLSKCIVRFHNSWGDGWGDHGCGRFRLSLYAALIGQVDIKQFVMHLPGQDPNVPGPGV